MIPGLPNRPRGLSRGPASVQPPTAIVGVLAALLLAGCERAYSAHNPPGTVLVRLCYFDQSIVRSGDQFFFVEPGRTTPIGPGVPLNDICRARA